MKRLMILLFALCMAFGGCISAKETNEHETPEPTKYVDTDDTITPEPTREITPASTDEPEPTATVAPRATAALEPTPTPTLTPKPTTMPTPTMTSKPTPMSTTSPTATQKPTKTPKPTSTKEPTKTPMKGIKYEGQYKVGVDIEPGEYVFFANSSSGYFCVSSDSNGNDIIANDNFSYNSIITIYNGEYLELSRCYAVPISEVPEISVDKGTMFKVGVHIPAGEYKLKTEGNSGYYCIYSDNRQDDIEANDNFKGQSYVTVSDGQYLELSRCYIERTESSNLKPEKPASEAKPTGEISQSTTGQKNALQKAKNYLEFMPFSYEGIISQLEYESYSHEEAVFAANNCGADWNEQAAKKAKNYLEFMPFSYEGIISQLEYESYSHEEAVFAADNCGADWNEQAAEKAKIYLDIMPFSKEELVQQLEYEGFTREQSIYGAEQNGY